MLAKLKNKIAGALLKVFASDSPLRKRLSDPQLIIQGAGGLDRGAGLVAGCCSPERIVHLPWQAK